MSATKKQPNKKARTFVKFDAKKKAAYIALLEKGGRRHVSARSVGITPQTVVNHMHSDPTFADAVSLAEMESDDEVEDSLRMAAISGNVTAALAWLYSRRPERWRDMRKVTLPIDITIWQRDYAEAIRKGTLTLSVLELQFGPDGATRILADIVSGGYMTADEVQERLKVKLLADGLFKQQAVTDEE